MPTRPGRLAGLLVVIAAVVAVSISGAGAAGKASPNDWSSWGNTPDQNRYTTLTQITPDNVAQLGRLFTVDFRAIDPAIRRGTQSFPLAIGGRLYVTTNDDNVFALNATTGAVIWRWKPDNVAIFRNFGIAANRGVAYCEGKLFITTLDMFIVSIDAKTGRQIKRVPISAAVPRATPAYGYSETSAPICADHRLVLGAAGSEYGVRGFVMAYKTDLTPAWPGPFWTIPPEGTSWRRLSRIVGGGVVWTPQTIDTTTHTLYFGTGSATPLYFPQFRPGQNPRTDSLIAVDLRTGQMKWWQQQMAFNEWSYDTAQPPLVYTGKVGGKTRRVVSVATMEGVWFAYDAATGAPIYQRIKVIDRTEHPRLAARQGGPGVPGLDRRAQLLAGLVRPEDELHLQRRRRDGLAADPGEADADPEEAQADPRRHLPRPGQRQLRAIPARLARPRLDQRDRREHRQARLEVHHPRAGARRRDHDRERARLRRRRRRRPARVQHEDRQGAVDVPDGAPDRSRPDDLLGQGQAVSGDLLGRQSDLVGRRHGERASGVRARRIAEGIAAARSPASSGPGRSRSPPPRSSTPTALPARPQKPAAARVVDRMTALGAARIVTQSGLVVRAWLANSSNTQDVTGRVLLGSTPVQGVQLAVGGYVLPALTAADGTFRYPVDITIPLRHVVSIVSTGKARVNGRALNADERSALTGLEGGFSVGYRVDDLKARAQKDGSVLVSGRLASAQGGNPPAVALYTYRLTGTVTDSAGKPVAGAVVVSRTQDRDFWTFSTPSDSLGRYRSFFAAADETAADPVTLSVQVAVGANSYGLPTGVNADFARLRSATMNLQLPPSGTGLAITKPSSYAGAVYEGVLVGVTGPGVVKPVSARWPDTRGNFSFVLPASMRGKTVRLWQSFQQLFQSSPTGKAGPIDLDEWPTGLAPTVPRDLATLKLPR